MEVRLHSRCRAGRATLAVGEASPVPETHAHTSRHKARWASSSAVCPSRSALPASDAFALWWLPQQNDIRSGCREALAHVLDAMLSSSKYRCFIIERAAWHHAEYEACAALCARVLTQHKNAGLLVFRDCLVTEPCRQRHARGIFRCDAAHIENDRAETTTL